jgi:gamma-glutamyl:cysteine ligase YbdK (ATP-grasp superfamily)
VNTAELRPLPIVDNIIEELHGEVVNEFNFGAINVSKELQKHVIEFVPSFPHTSIAALEKALYDGMMRFHDATGNRYHLLGLGMHPLLTLDQTAVWDHEDKDIYDAYDRVFGLCQHGWLNIQALQVNVHYESEEMMVRMFDRLRALVPFLVAVTASSPFMEGRRTSSMDNRLLFYRKNQSRVPKICNGLVPERLECWKDHDEILESIYRDLRRVGGEELCHEWVDSRGVIVRPHRECLELKVVDEQECLRSDMAATAFVLALLRADLHLEEDQGSLYDMTEQAIHRGTGSCRAELRKLLTKAEACATAEERAYLPLIKRRIEEGSVAELMDQKVKDGSSIVEVATDMSRRLHHNVPL